MTSAIADLGVGDDHASALRSHLGLTWVLARKNFQVRYKRAVLGVVWAVVQPSFQAAFLSVIFLYVFRYGRGIEHYPLYVLSGILPWAFFTQGVSAATGSVVENASLVRKVSLPRVIFPIAAVGGVGLAFLASLGVLVVAAVAVGSVGLSLLWLPVAVVLQVAAVAAVGTFACAFHVAFRDVKYVVESALMVGLYATPVLYDLGRAPDAVQNLLRLNPMTGIVMLYRAAILEREIDFAAVGLSAVVTVVLLAVAVTTFVRRSDEFPDLV